MANNSSNNSKKILRKENKKRKLKALCMITSLNEEDKKKEVLETVAEEEGMDEEEEMVSLSSKRVCEDFVNNNRKRKLNEDMPKNTGDENVVKPSEIKRDLTYDELKKLRMLINQKRAAKKKLPKLHMKEAGFQASIDYPKEKRIPLFLSDIQHFILFSLHGHMSTGNIPRWIGIEKYPSIKNVLYLVVEGMSLSDYENHENLCPTLKQFPHKLEVITPLAYGGNLVSEMVTVPLTESQRHKLEKKFSSLGGPTSQSSVFKVFRTLFPMGFLKKSSPTLDINNQTKDKFSRTELLLSPWQMIEENYPLPLEGELKLRYSNYVYTRDVYTEVTPNSPMWALDCEMCNTKIGSELTRVSIINENFELMYETFVKPYNPITDYVTRYSGITAKDLENVETRLEDVQNKIREIIPPDAILIGQSLNMDLHSLKMFHPYCIDTSVIFNLSGERMRKTKLKVLSSEFLGEQIQNNQNGHDSIEDASACMKLVQQKLKKSIGWGDAVISGPYAVEQMMSETQKLLREKRLKTSSTSDEHVNSKSTSPSQTAAVKSQDLMRGIVKNKHSLPKYVKGEAVAQVEVFTTSLFSHLIHYEKECLFVAKPSIINECIKYIPDVVRPFQPDSRVKISKQETNKEVIKYGRKNSPNSAVTFMFVNIEGEPEHTAVKVDNLVKHLIKDITGNVLVTVLLAGRNSSFDKVDTSNHGLMFTQLHQEPIPAIQFEGDTFKI